MSTDLTVIMPVRNGARFLEPALASLESQAYRGFALHVWDDGSDDDTLAILQRWLPARLPGRVIGQARIGIGPALGRLVEAAPTELIARMDADDVCDPARFERQLAFMKQHPDLAVLGTQMRRHDQATNKDLGPTSHPLNDAEIRWAMRLINPINHPTVMMRRAKVLACGNYRDLRPGQDDDLWLRIARHDRLANLPDCLLTYREHPASVTARRDDPVRVFRDRRMDDARLVFPGLPVEDARRLTRLLTKTDELDVSRADLSLLDRAATLAAQQTNEPGSYFKQTNAYRQQRLNLLVRWLKRQPMVGRAWPVVRCAGWLAHRRHADHNASQQTPTQGGAAWASRG